MLNKFQIIGRLGKDPEAKFTKNNLEISSFSVAVSEKYKDKETTNWFNISMFGKTAKIANQYLTKGSLVYLEGNMRNEEYEKDGEKRFAWKFIANNMKMLGSKGDKKETPKPKKEEDKPFEYDDNIPF